MTLTAPYGMGKTTFFRCWAQDLKNQSIHSVTFNAWESDYSNDAFSAFVSSILKQLPASSAKAKVQQKALKIGAAILRKTPALLAKAATKHLIGDEAAKDLKNISLSEDDLAGLTESVAKEMFDQQEKIQNAVAEFKETLETIITKELNGELYILIDELDRCRPSYAVEVLERIKHIFSVRGAKFIIAIDDNQLQNAVKGVYGADIDSSGYLRKFIDWNHDLSEPSSRQYVEHLYNNIFMVNTERYFSENLYEEFNSNAFKRSINLLIETYGLSLRDIDRYFTYLRLLPEDTNSRKAAQIEIYIAAFFKCIFPSSYKEIINWRGDSLLNETPFEAAILRMIDSLTDTIDNGMYSGKDEAIWSIVILVMLMSKPVRIGDDKPKFCISAETQKKILHFNDRMTTEWLSNRIQGDHRNSFPNVLRGMKFLNKIDP